MLSIEQITIPLTEKQVYMLLDENNPHTVDDLVERFKKAYSLSDSYADLYSCIATHLSQLENEGYLRSRDIPVRAASPVLRSMTRYHAFIRNGRMGITKKYIGLACLEEVREGVLQASRYRETAIEQIYFKVSEPDFDVLCVPRNIPEPAFF